MSALLHALVLVVLVLSVEPQPLGDARQPVLIEVVMQPVVATAPTPPVQQPSSVLAAPAVPDVPAITPETAVAAPELPQSAVPVPTVPAAPPPPEAPIAPTGQQAELPPPLPPTLNPLPPAPAVSTPLVPVPTLSLPTVPVPTKAHEQRLRERLQHTHHEVLTRPAQPMPPTEAPQSPASATAPAHADITAPTAVTAAPASTQSAATWRDRLAAWLSAHKSYPEAAREQNDEGVVVVRFTIAHDGRVLEVVVVRSSGHPVLDDATKAMLRDATVPALPPEMPQSQETITVPLRYTLIR